MFDMILKIAIADKKGVKVIENYQCQGYVNLKARNEGMKMNLF